MKTFEELLFDTEIFCKTTAITLKRKILHSQILLTFYFFHIRKEQISSIGIAFDTQQLSLAIFIFVTLNQI